MTFSHTSTRAVGFDTSTSSSDNPPVFRRVLWQVTQYLSSTARCSAGLAVEFATAGAAAGAAFLAGCGLGACVKTVAADATTAIATKYGNRRISGPPAAALGCPGTDSYIYDGTPWVPAT